MTNLPDVPWNRIVQRMAILALRNAGGGHGFRLWMDGLLKGRVLGVSPPPPLGVPGHHIGDRRVTGCPQRRRTARICGAVAAAVIGEDGRWPAAGGHRVRGYHHRLTLRFLSATSATFAGTPRAAETRTVRYPRQCRA